MIKLFFQVLRIFMVVFVLGFIYCWITDSSDLSVLTEAGQAREVRYQEYKGQEDENRAAQRERERFERRYENEQ